MQDPESALVELESKDGSKITCHMYGISTLIFIYNRLEELRKTYDIDFISIAHIHHESIKQYGQCVDQFGKVYKLEKQNKIWPGKKVHVFMNMTVPAEYQMPEPVGIQDLAESSLSKMITHYTWTEIQSFIQAEEIETLETNENIPHHIQTTMDFVIYY